jgi:hypothetical protein
MPSAGKYDAGNHYLLKAESLCAELMANGVSFDDLIIHHAGSFRKSYRNDIEEVAVPEGEKGPIIITINRDGVYDKLPEGLFHQTKGGSSTASLKAMVGEYRIYRDEEKAARKFFQPVEQELFRYSLMAEQEERKLQFGILNGNLDAEFYRFWNIEADLPEEPAALLVLIMPWINQIKGDPQLTAKALSITLGKNVSLEEGLAEDLEKSNASFTLGNGASLSIDTVCGSHFSEPYARWIFRIEGLREDEMILYTPDFPFGRFIRRFEELFIPLEVEADFEYQYGHVPGDEQHENILGYGYYL